MYNIISEEHCKGCPFATIWPGRYGSGMAYHGCNHPKLGKTKFSLSECPKEKE